MMLFLPQHIHAHLFEVRSAHGECAVTFLPGKAVQSEFFANPPRGLAFKFAHDIGQAMRRAQSREYMDVILPRKLALAADYADHASLWTDLAVIGRSVGVLLFR